jgi:eukaryotic-like serine/threonine-protein kinase
MRLGIIGLIFVCAVSLQARPAGRQKKLPKPPVKPALTMDFPAFKGGPDRRGWTANNLTAPVSLKWKFDTDSAVYSSPAVSGDFVYVATPDEEFFAVDRNFGQLLWKTEMEDKIYGSSPAVDSGLVWIASIDGCVNGLEASSGVCKYTFCVERIGLMGQKPDLLGSVLASGGRILFGSDNYEFYAWQPGRDQPDWAVATEGKIHDNAAAVRDGVAYFGSQDGCLYAVEEATGKLKWKTADFKWLNTCPVVGEEQVYFGAGDNFMRALNLSDGSLAWKFETGHGIISSPALSPAGELVFGSADKQVYCLDSKTG